MKNIKLILSFCLLLAITFSCIKKKESNEKVITANKVPAKKMSTKKNNAVKNANNENISEFAKSMNEPFTLVKNKGKFLEEINGLLKLSPEEKSNLNSLINKYQRKGMDLRFFGAFYNTDDKPFSKELVNILSPIQVEKFKHFHSYWFDRVPTINHAYLPVSIFYRIGLNKEQFYSFVDIYSDAAINKKIKKEYKDFFTTFYLFDDDTHSKILNILNENQKGRYILIQEHFSSFLL